MLKAIELKVGQSEPIGDKDRARLKLDGSGTTLEFRGADGKPLARLAVGAKFFKREPDNRDARDRRRPLRAAARGTEDRDTWSPTRSRWPARRARTGSAARASRAEKVKAMEVAPGRRREVEDRACARRRGLEAHAVARAGEKLDIDPSQLRLYSLNSVELADVARAGRQARGHRPGQALRQHRRDDLRRPRLHAEARQARGRQLLRHAGGGRHGQGERHRTRPSGRRRSTSGCRARGARRAHVCSSPKSKFDDILKKRAELLEKKAGGKK